MTRIIIQAVRERQNFIDYLSKHLPEAEWCFDQKRDAFDTFLRSLEMAGSDPCIHMEEDVILTRDFVPKIEAAIRRQPNAIIQFFSMRQADLTIGSRWDSKFMMNQCWYAPAGYTQLFLDFYPRWLERDQGANPHGYDTMMQAFLKARRERYWIHVPSLVDHRVSVSMIDKRRSSKRQSLTFTDPVE